MERQSPIERPKPKAKSVYIISRLGRSRLFQVKNRQTGQVLAFGTGLEGAKQKVRELESGVKYV